MKVLLLESDPNYASEMQRILNDNSLTLVGTVTSIKQAEVWLHPGKIDLIISELAEQSGQSTLPLLNRTQMLSTPIIFITDHPYSLAYEHIRQFPHAALLIKPFHRLTLQCTIDLLYPTTEYVPYTPIQAVFVRNNQSKMERIDLNEIQWVESEGNYAIIQTENKRYAVKRSLQKMVDLLDRRFLRVHKSFIVNLNQIDNISLLTMQITIHQQVIPIGRTYRKDIRDSVPIA
nr:LytTR family DNA-binding domain-containing protein [uncultured Arsenicibacter sp.]